MCYRRSLWFYSDPLLSVESSAAVACIPCPSGDEVCPEKFAKDLVAMLEKAGVPHNAKFIDAGHMAKSDGMSTALRACVDEFLAERESSSSGGV